MATVNQPIQLKFNASDDGTFVYQVLDQPGSGFSFDGSSGVATWTPTDTNVVNIRLLCAVFFKLIPVFLNYYFLYMKGFFMTSFLALHNLKKKKFFSVTAVDNQNVSASPVDVAIILCSGCNSHGDCNYNSTRSTTSSMFNLASCVCYTGYDGNLNNKKILLSW